MSNVVETVIVYNHFPGILEDLLLDIDHQLHLSAGEIRQGAQERVRVRTGGTKASVYVSTPEGSTYGDAVSEASGKDPHAQMLPEEKPEGQHEAVIGVANSAGIFEEYGARHTPAAPFLTPAADEHHPKFVRAIEDLIDRL